MSAIVFAGPSIPRDTVQSFKRFEWRPPVSQGDVYRAAKKSPRVIAIIDGYFEGVPSVWHKEILWAISEGITVFGASSMGALRAAELHPFGMKGVGEIFENYRNGVFEDDDEVAVMHGPAELGYLSLNVPMVNIRATLQLAQQHEVISQETASRSVEIAKSMFYQQRQWKNFIQALRDAAIDELEVASLEAWVPENAVDVKRRDAETLLHELNCYLAEGESEGQPDYTFEWTVMWDSVVSGKTDLVSDSLNAFDDDMDKSVLDELRLQPERYRQMRTRTCLKQLALREAGRRQVAVEIADTRKKLQQLRELHQLYSHEKLVKWMEANDLSENTLQKVLEDEQKSHAVVQRFAVFDSDLLLDELKLSGEYHALKTAAQTRESYKAGKKKAPDLMPAQLLTWYFESVRKEAIPDDIDHYLSSLDINDRSAFYKLLKSFYLIRLANGDKRQ